MFRSRIGWVLSLAFILTLWGCSQSDTALSSRTHRLQEEVQGLAATRDQLRQDLRKAQEEKTRLSEQLDQARQVHLDLTKERDDLRQTLAARIAERDHTQAQLDQLRKGIHAIMDQLDAMATPAENGAATANATTNAN